MILARILLPITLSVFDSSLHRAQSNILKIIGDIMKQLTPTAINGLMVLAVTANASHALAEVSVEVAVQSDYVWRGITQSADAPSFQLGLDYAHESGLYVGTWGASVDFGGSEDAEIDFYAGYAKEFESGVGIDVGITEYTYHGGSGANDSNFTEYYASMSFKGATVSYAIGDECADNIELSYAITPFESANTKFSATFGDYDDYQYYKAGISDTFPGDTGIDWDLSYWDTDIKDDPASDGRLVLTVSKSF